MPNQPQSPGVSTQVPAHLADLRVQPADESTWQTIKRNLTPQVDTSRSARGAGQQFSSDDSPQQTGEQQYGENFGSPLQQAYGKMKNFLGEHEQHLSEKVLKPFRQGLDNMADDLEEAAGTGHTRTGGELTPVTRLLAGGVGRALRFVPIGSNVKETAAALVVPPEMGPEGKALSKKINAAQKAEPVYAYRTRDVGEQGIPADSRSHAHATMSEEEAKSYSESRGKVQGKPQETVRFRLDKVKPEDYERKAGPGGSDWIKLKKAVPEEATEKLSPNADAVARNRPEIATDNINRAKKLGIETTPEGNLVLYHGTKSGDVIRSSGNIKQGSYLAADEKTARQYAEGATGPEAKTEVMRVEVPAGTVLGNGNYFSANEEIPYKAAQAAPKPATEINQKATEALGRKTPAPKTPKPIASPPQAFRNGQPVMIGA